ncbi:hypothetical protein MTO96_019866 [Rhipicephalus appendiculatus]
MERRCVAGHVCARERAYTTTIHTRGRTRVVPGPTPCPKVPRGARGPPECAAAGFTPVTRGMPGIRFGARGPHRDHHARATRVDAPRHTVPPIPD